jgi:ketohexokinase
MPAESASRAVGRSASVLGVGIATLDIVNQVSTYPVEDAEVRALDQRIARGGNVANSLAVLRQFGRRCIWAGTLADDAGARFIGEDFARCGIDSRPAVRLRGTRTPTSYIALSRATGSRTIIHHRDLREFSARDFDAVSLAGLDWVHFEGRAPDETAAMIARVRRERPGLPISVEIEKPRDGIERLFQGATVLIFARAFAELVSAPDSVEPRAFLRERLADCDADYCLLPWGSAGAFGVARGSQPICFAPAYRPASLVDTLAAGDVFNASVIDGMLRGLELPLLLARANRIAGHKCARQGLDGLIDSAADAGLL